MTRTTRMTQDEWLLLCHAVHAYSFVLFPRARGTPTTCADLAAAVKTTYCQDEPRNAAVVATLQQFGHLPLERDDGNTCWRLAVT